MMKAFSGGSAMWREWGMTRLLRKYAGSHSVGRPRKRWIDTKEVWISGNQGESMIRVNSRGNTEKEE